MMRRSERLLTKNPWRYIPLLRAPGELQMAIDSWLLEQHRQGNHPPTLRFYTWEPVAISLGYHQRSYPPEWEHLTWQGQKIALVRRPTGGRAVLHQGDLTYSLITSGLEGNVYQVYTTVCEFLIRGWEKLGQQLYYGREGKGYIGQSNCFALATGADLVDRFGHKFIGSAQLRQGKTILQHGSMLLDVNGDLFTQVFAQASPPRLDFPLEVRTPQGQQTIIGALLEAAQACFQVEFLEQPLSEQELAAIMPHQFSQTED